MNFFDRTFDKEKPLKSCDFSGFVVGVRRFELRASWSRSTRPSKNIHLTKASYLLGNPSKYGAFHVIRAKLKKNQNRTNQIKNKG